MTALGVVSVVLIAYGDEPTLERALDALALSEGVTLDVVVVDNGVPSDVSAYLAQRSDVTLVGPPRNRGFTGGCADGAEVARGDTIVFLNSDAFVEVDAVANLAAAVQDPAVGIATASLRLADSHELLNSAGNPVHFSGLTWSGAFGEPASGYAEAFSVASASGAAMALRRDVWVQLGGFNDELFAYLEDTELSLRCWQQGLTVTFVPDAVVLHEYEFGRHPLKMYLLERNRWIILLTLYGWRTLVILAPALLLVELAICAQAAGGRWFGAKMRGWVWILRHVPALRRRRAVVRAAMTVPEAMWIARLIGAIEPANVPLPPGMGLFNAVLSGYWRLVRAIAFKGADAAPSTTRRLRA